MKCMKKDRKRDHTSEEKIILGQNPSGFKVQREKKVFGREKERKRETIRKAPINSYTKKKKRMVRMHE